MTPKVTSRQIKKETMAALWTLSHDPSLGYLAITSKPEIQVRDRVAWWFHRKCSWLVTAREYQIKSRKIRERRKKVDLALLNAALDPVAIMEFKAIIVPDPLADPEHHLMLDLEEDMARLAKITHVPCFGVMLMVHIEDISPVMRRGLHQGVVKYANNFRRWAKDNNAFREAVKRARRFFPHGEPNSNFSLTIDLGSVWGARVKLACFILDPKRMS